MDDYNESINWLKAFQSRSKKLDLTRELQLDAEAIIEGFVEFIKISENYIIAYHECLNKNKMIYVFSTEDLSLIEVIEGKVFRSLDGDYLAYEDDCSSKSYLRNIKAGQEYELDDDRIIDINGNGNILTYKGLYKIKGNHLELIFRNDQIPFNLYRTIVTKDYLLNDEDSTVYIFDINSGITVKKNFIISNLHKVDSERNIIMIDSIDSDYELTRIKKDSLENIKFLDGFWGIETINKSLDYLVFKDYHDRKTVVNISKEQQFEKTFSNTVERLKVNPDGTAIFMLVPYFYNDNICHKIMKFVSPPE